MSNIFKRLYTQFLDSYKQSISWPENIKFQRQMDELSAALNRTANLEHWTINGSYAISKHASFAIDIAQLLRGKYIDYAVCPKTYRQLVTEDQHQELINYFKELPE